MRLAVRQYMVSTVGCVLYCWCDTGTGGGWGPGYLLGARDLPSTSVLSVGEVLLLLLSLVSGCSSILFLRLHSRLLGAVCCFVSAAPVCVGCFLPLLAALGLVSVVPCPVLGPRSSTGSLSCSALWGFRLLFVLLHLFPPLRLFLGFSDARKHRSGYDITSKRQK